mmetsp:Transcript_3600/g.5227  ORF Transcript_3600/g.5227 Transcript_3600/m.5227 type:complete len:122 (-) Transcript_3600:666-1031(-)
MLLNYPKRFGEDRKGKQLHYWKKKYLRSGRVVTVRATERKDVRWKTADSIFHRELVRVQEDRWGRKKHDYNKHSCIRRSSETNGHSRDIMRIKCGTLIVIYINKFNGTMTVFVQSGSIHLI